MAACHLHVILQTIGLSLKFDHTKCSFVVADNTILVHWSPMFACFLTLMIFTIQCCASPSPSHTQKRLISYSWDCVSSSTCICLTLGTCTCICCSAFPPPPHHNPTQARPEIILIIWSFLSIWYYAVPSARVHVHVHVWAVYSQQYTCTCTYMYSVHVFHCQTLTNLGVICSWCMTQPVWSLVLLFVNFAVVI